MPFTVDNSSAGQVFKNLSRTQPGSLKRGGGLSGTESLREQQNANNRRVFEGISASFNRQPDRVDVGRQLRDSDKGTNTQSLRAALRNTNKGISIANEAKSGLEEIRARLLELRELAKEAEAENLDTDERVVLADKAAVKVGAAEKVAVETEFDGLRLLDGSIGAGQIEIETSETTVTVVPAPPFVTALVAQTQVLAQDEDINFKDSGIFAGLNANDRKIQLSSGDTQQDVVDAINNDSVVGALVEASVDGDGKLVITALASGGNVTFEVDSNKNEASDTTGIGKTDLVGDNGTDDVTAAAFVIAPLDLQIDDGAGTGNKFSLFFDEVTSDVIGTDDLDFSTAENATASVQKIDDALAAVQKAIIRTDVSIQRLGSIAKGIAGKSSALTSAREAEDLAKAAREQTRSNATDAIVSSANARPELALQLLA